VTLAASAGLALILAFLFSMLGLGGALLYIPVFNWLGYGFKEVAIPTGLLLNGITALSASAYYLKARMVDVSGALPLIVTSFIGAPIGAWVSGYMSEQVLIGLFAAAMAVAGARMLITSQRPDSAELMERTKQLALTGTAGFFIGFLAGLLGIGGGFLIVPMLIAIGYPTKRAAATSAFAVIFSSFSGFAAHVSQGHFDWPLMAITLIAVVVGSQVGARTMKEKLSSAWIKGGFGVLLLGVAVKLASQALL